MKIILASASPRRRELLDLIDWKYQVIVSTVEEKITKTAPDEVVEELSAQKALDVSDKLRGEQAQELCVIGADTVVACTSPDTGVLQILGKPADKADACRMLSLLQGNTHEVYTGVTICYHSADGNRVVHTFHERTKVEFYPMSPEEINSYVDTAEPMDKAGAYGIQGLCARYIRGIEGDYHNVVGLPVGRLYQEMRRLLTPKKAVVFDLDGTLTDTIASIKYCGNAAVAPFGIGPFTEEQYCYFVGDGAANLIKRCLLAGGDEALVHYEEAYSRYLEIFKEYCMYQVAPYAGITDLLAGLKERGMKCAVLSNKPHEETVRVVETFFGQGCFDVISGQKPKVAIKPSPEGVYHIMERLGLEAEELLYLGDTGTDMKTGKSAGAFTVGALWGFREEQELRKSGADAIIGHPTELLWYC